MRTQQNDRISPFSLLFPHIAPIVQSVRLSSPFTRPMNNHQQHKSCLVDGCTAQTHGKTYCHAHIKNKGKVEVISDAQRSHMRSDCCNAPCLDGPRHEYGRQYCRKCKAGCCWHPHVLLAAHQPLGVMR